MKTLLKIVSFAGLILMAASAILVFDDKLAHDRYLILALVGTVMWFATVPFWMKRRLHQSE